jgi:hypothetical protein
MGSILVKFCQKTALKKVDGSVFFWTDFCLFLPKTSLYGFIEKQAPQKALCLGPDPPPWRKCDFYWFLSIFSVFGAFNRAGKTVTKIGIYSKPPQKSEIYAVLLIRDPIYQHFNLSRPITELLAIYFGPWYCFVLFPFLVLSRTFYSEFFWLWFCFGCWIVVFLGLSHSKQNHTRHRRKPLKQGTLERNRKTPLFEFLNQAQTQTRARTGPLNQAQTQAQDTGAV